MNDWLRSAFGPPTWVAEVDRDTLRRDLVAGLSVGVMLVPQAMAYATLAGLPAQYGLYASLVPLLGYPIFGSARQLAVGIVALDMLIVAAGLAPMAEPGSERFIALAITLAALVGLIQFGMGLLNLGFLSDLLSRPVVTGFTTAAALVIASSQLGPLLGLDVPRSEFVVDSLGDTFRQLGSTHGFTALVGGGGLAVMALLKRFRPRVPAALVVIVLGTFVTWNWDLGAKGVAVTGRVPAGLPGLDFPLASWADVRALLPVATTLALLQLLTAISLGRALSARHRYTIRPNRELLALGAGNLLGSLFRGVPVSASFSRSAVNERSGAQTPLANVAAALLVALTLLFLTPLFSYLPGAALAAIIVVSVLGLVSPAEFVRLVRTHRRDGIVALLTVGATLVLGIQEGVVVGVVASTLAVLYRMSRPPIAELGLLPGTRFFRDRARFTEAEPVPGLEILRVDAAFSFFNAAWFREKVLDRSREEGEGEGLRAVIVEGRGINDLDTTAVDVLRELVGTLHQWGIQLYLAGLKGRVRDVLVRSGLAAELPSDTFHLTTDHAVRHLLARWDAEDGGRRLEGYDRRSGEDGPEEVDHGVPLT
ncbi:MAG TPA: sulfate permease [Longimicrobiales bacterium]|nr:sulfate permease [Longimicrobiales bacterium]